MEKIKSFIQIYNGEEALKDLFKMAGKKFYLTEKISALIISHLTGFIL
jgi:hypothetical protein